MQVLGRRAQRRSGPARRCHRRRPPRPRRLRQRAARCCNSNIGRRLARRARRAPAFLRRPGAVRVCGGRGREIGEKPFGGGPPGGPPHVQERRRRQAPLSTAPPAHGRLESEREGTAFPQQPFHRALAARRRLRRASAPQGTERGARAAAIAREATKGPARRRPTAEGPEARPRVRAACRRALGATPALSGRPRSGCGQHYCLSAPTPLYALRGPVVSSLPRPWLGGGQRQRVRFT